KADNNRIVKRYDEELLIIEAWGENSLRVRSFLDQHFVDRENALTEELTYDESKVEVSAGENEGTIINGDIKAVLDHRDRITFYDKNDNILLEEFIRLRAVKHDDGSEDVGTV